MSSKRTIGSGGVLSAPALLNLYVLLDDRSELFFEGFGTLHEPVLKELLSVGSLLWVLLEALADEVLKERAPLGGDGRWITFHDV